MHAAHAHRATSRPAYAALAAALLTVALYVPITEGTGWWQFFAFGAAPDLVPLYNALHRFAGPLAFALLAAAFLPAGYLVGALAWGLHIAVDRVAGYGLRTPDGFQRS